MRAEIKRWGNSAAVRLPKKLLHRAQLDIDSEVTMQAEENRIIIEAVRDQRKGRLQLPFDEAMLLADLDPAKAHADELEPLLLDRELGD